MLIYHPKTIIVLRDYKKFIGRNQDVFINAVFCFESELLLINLTVSGVKSSAVSRKICNLHTVKISFHSNSLYIAQNLRILNVVTYEGPIYRQKNTLVFYQ